MAFDGICVRALVSELNKEISDARMFKIAQPERDELLLTLKSAREQKKLLISANPSLPLVYFLKEGKQAPLTAPAFCMLLRKHIQNGKILRIYQPSMERIICFDIESYNEMGDLTQFTLLAELMGKHSNIIFLKDGVIVDAIKRISFNVSSVREVLPGREYFVPDQANKINPFEITEVMFKSITNVSDNISKVLYSSITGFSPSAAAEVCYRAGIDNDRAANSLSENESIHLFNCLLQLIDDIKNDDFKPAVVYENDKPLEVIPVRYKSYEDFAGEDGTYHIEYYDSISSALSDFYRDKEIYGRIRQKSVDIRQIVQNALSKDVKKYDLQMKQLKDTDKKEKYKLYGELLTTYGYGIEDGAKSTTVNNYYTGEDIQIPLDETLSAIDNAKKYFEKYSKLKRTYEALKDITEETEQEIEYLTSVMHFLTEAKTDAELSEIKEELRQSGFIKTKTQDKKQNVGSKPMHFVSSDGFDIFVGKNNLQNEYVTFKLADGRDWWFHAKKMAGSHVIVKSSGKELPDSTFEEAARLAAYYSKGRNQDKVEVDYVLRKELRKPPSANAGLVIYHTNYSMTIDTDITNIEEINNG